MTEERVVVEVEFRVQRQDLAAGRDDERIHFHHRAIARHEGAVETVE